MFQGVIPPKAMYDIIKKLLRLKKLIPESENLVHTGGITRPRNKRYDLWVKNRRKILKNSPK